MCLIGVKETYVQEKKKVTKNFLGQICTTVSGLNKTLQTTVQLSNTDLQRIDPVGVSLQRMCACLCLRIPDAYCVVIGTRHNSFPIVLDTTHRSHVTHQHVQALTRFNVPHTQSCVPWSTHNPGTTAVSEITKRLNPDTCKISNLQKKYFDLITQLVHWHLGHAHIYILSRGKSSSILMLPDLANTGQ